MIHSMLHSHWNCLIDDTMKYVLDYFEPPFNFIYYLSFFNTKEPESQSQSFWRSSDECMRDTTCLAPALPVNFHKTIKQRKFTRLALIWSGNSIWASEAIAPPIRSARLKVLASIALERGVICNNFFSGFWQKIALIYFEWSCICVTVRERKILALQLILVVIVILCCNHESDPRAATNNTWSPC